MAEYGSAMTWMMILLSLATLGLLYIFLMPVIDTFITMGLSNTGCDEASVAVIRDTIKYWFPLTFVISLIIYGYRRSGSRVS